MNQMWQDLQQYRSYSWYDVGHCGISYQMVSQEAVAFDDCTDCADAGGYTDFMKTMVQ